MDNACTDDACEGAVLYRLKEEKGKVFAHVYNALNRDRPLEEVPYEIRRMSARCGGCDHSIKIDDHQYCIKPKPEDARSAAPASKSLANRAV